MERRPVLASDVTAHIMTTYESGQLITICGWCKRIELDGQWEPAPRAALSSIDAVHTLSHSICPDCVAALDHPPREDGLA